MRYLLDTHVLLWAASEPDKISEPVRRQLEDPLNELVFSAASFWEIAIKNGLERPDFKVEMWILRRSLLDNGYEELPVTSEHAAFTQMLERHHKDPFDRMLIAQACVEDLTLITADWLVAQYPGPIQKI